MRVGPVESGLESVTKRGHRIPGTSASSTRDIAAMWAARTPAMRSRNTPGRWHPGAGGRVPADRSDRGLAAQRLARRVLGRTMRRLWPIELRGFDKVPSEGPVVLCANHLSFFDSVLLPDDTQEDGQLRSP